MKSLAIALLALSVFLVGFQSPKVEKPTFAKNVQPTLKKFCVACHAGANAPDKIDFFAMKTEADAKKNLKVLKKALEEIREKAMPPGEVPKPSMAEIKAFSDYLKSVK